MKQWKILILTDHSGHSASNSIYNLAAALKHDPRSATVWIASRGQTVNKQFFFELEDLPIEAHEVTPSFSFEQGQSLFSTEGALVRIQDFDLIWLRLPRPIPEGFFEFLETRFPDQIFLNRPSGIKTSSSKAFLLNVPELCPPIRHCKTIEEVIEMQQLFPIVLKPIEDYGGRGIVRVENGMVFLGDGPTPLVKGIKELEAQFQIGGYLAMQFLKNVSQGDKRVVVVNGEVIGGVLRLPPEGSWICNASQGGQAQLSVVDDRERRMADRLHQELGPLGIVMFGMDTLVNDEGIRILSEVNTLSIGGIQALDDFSGPSASERVVKNLLNFAEGLVGIK